MSTEEKKSKPISRRDFVKGAAAGMAAVTAGTVLAGCAPKTVTPEAAIADAPTTAATAGAACSATSTDVMSAEMAAKKWNFEIAPAPIADSDIANTVTADVVVVGSGIAGLAVANSAVENGAKVILISASSAVIYRGGSFHAANSKVMQAAKIEPYDVGQFFKREMSCNSFNIDERKWYKFYNNSEEAINWLIDKMEANGYQCVMELDNFEADNGPMNAPAGSHAFINDKMTMTGLGAQFVAETLAKTATAAGAQIIYKTVAEQLVRDDNNTGRVSAVIAKGEDGKYTKYAATKGVVLATGDFSGNIEMMTKYCPWAIPLLHDNDKVNYDNTFKFGGLFPGDGQKMGLWIGAAWQKTFPNAPMIQGSWIAANQPYGGHRGLLINKDGFRYGNEDANGPYSGIAQMHQPDMKAYAIWGSNYAQDGAPWYSFGMKQGDAPVPPETIVEGWEKSVKAGTYVKADKVEDVIKALGLPAEATKATIDHYNELAAAGVDTDFHKKKEYLAPISTGPFYGGEALMPDFLTVLGGLRTNLNMQVCDEKDQPIPGLFNVGTMVGDYYANAYTFSVAGNNYGGNCITFGYLTGRAIAKGEIA
jgi:succinate dehydrogenase/fumarate reductase flavoprotein subunit